MSLKPKFAAIAFSLATGLSGAANAAWQSVKPIEFKKLHYPLAPLVLAIVIGDKAEDAFRQSMLMSRGSLAIFFSNTLVTTLVLLGAALLVLPVIWQAIGKMTARLPLEL